MVNPEGLSSTDMQMYLKKAITSSVIKPSVTKIISYKNYFS